MITIDVKNLNKVYRLYQSPAHRLKEIILRKPFHTEFSALSNINFSVFSGETFGIIGENGAGKSTLLKILARTLKPTSGSVTITGRTAALLELGAGFNPELSGEENIYLNAYLLGLSKDEIDSKKQEIIDFSELGDFIKRPVKTYSSGMHVRLAFSIATSVNPEVLIIDEALSVGDQHFQKKCVDRMMQFKHNGKTIVFCSHSMYMVQELCSKTIWLNNGSIAKIGDSAKVINAYNDWSREKSAGMKPCNIQAGNKKETLSPVWFKWVKITDSEGTELEWLKTGQDVWLTMCIGSRIDISYQGHIGIGINRNDEEPIFGVTTKIDSLSDITFYNGQQIRVKLPSLALLSGQYYALVFLTDEHALHPHDVQRTEAFFVENPSGERGIVKLAHTWEFPVEADLE